MTSELWYPLLALLERPDHGGAPDPQGSLPLNGPPSPQLREALLNLCQALHQELGAAAPGQPLWLLLDVGAGLKEAPTPGGEPQAGPSPLEVQKVLEEFRERFQELRQAGPDGAQAPPDFENFLRQKMRELGFDDVSSAPMLPELQREALRGLGVGLGSQMAQMVGRMAGWHGEARPPRNPAEKEPKAPVRLLRLDLSPTLAADRHGTLVLRQDLSKARRRLSQHLGWELSGAGVAVDKTLAPSAWRLFLRGEPVEEGFGYPALTRSVETLLTERADALFTFSDFATMLRQPGCKLVAKELSSLGLEKAVVWTIFRHVLAAGGHLREPLTTLERILEASITTQQVPHLVQAALGQPLSEG